MESPSSIESDESMDADVVSKFYTTHTRVFYCAQIFYYTHTHTHTSIESMDADVVGKFYTTHTHMHTHTHTFFYWTQIFFYLHTHTSFESDKSME